MLMGRYLDACRGFPSLKMRIMREHFRSVGKVPFAKHSFISLLKIGESKGACILQACDEM